MVQSAFTPLADRFALLQAEFEETSRRLSDTTDWTERKTMLRELRRILAEFDYLADNR